uniref:TIR domain-containing protein n=1 Tax=Anopheles culicifacies TaxID=139723 RepID=A0A182MAU0_9DIPT
MPIGNQSLVDILSGFIDRVQLNKIRKLFFVKNVLYSVAAPLEPALFANLTKLEVLSMKNSSLLPLNNSRLFEGITQLRWIDLREGDGGPNVAGSLLRPLINLTTLELMENNLTKLPDGLLSRLPMLESVNLYKNKLQQLDKFVELPMLNLVELYDNQLTVLQEDVFSELPALSELELGFNNLSSLPGGLLKNNFNLTSFSAKQQRSAKLVLGDGLFAGLRKLERVILYDSQIAELPEGLFAGTTALQTLDLSNNMLRTLPATLLHDLSNLRELYLSNNELRNLPDTLLQGTDQLRILDLSHNQLTTLNQYFLQSKSNLEELYLEYNQLHIIDGGAFEGQTRSLKTLNLSHNRVALHVDGMPVMYKNGTAFHVNQTPFSLLDSITRLDLSHNEIVTVFRDFTYSMPNLIELDLSHNRITQVTFPYFPSSTKVVDLQSNYITQLHLEPFNKDSLSMEILLDNNPVNCDCRMYSLVQYLHEEGLAESSFPFKGARCASPLELSHRTVYDIEPIELNCQLDAADTFCPAECTCYKRPADHVLIVNCNDQNLTVVPAISSPTVLSDEGYRFIELNLANNMLQELQMTGKGWTSVRQLLVANNNLTELPYDSLPEQLEVIDASGNQLAKFDPLLVRVLANRTKLRDISLSGNPWHCECDEPLLQFVSDNVARITDFSHLRCADGQPINTGTQKALCQYRTVLIVVLSVVVACLAIAGLIFYWLYTRYQHEIKVWLFKHDRLRWLVEEEQIDQDKRYDAFISYSHKDEDFIVSTLMPKLEGAPWNFKLCWHVRDFMPGELISSQITKAVEDSRRTIIVLSPNYIESVWGQMEFNTAYLQSVADKRNRVIPIIYEDIGDIETVDAELRAYLKTNTYVRWDDPWFWDKLRYAMPHPRRPKGVQASDNMASVDKLNLLEFATQKSAPSLQSTPPIDHAPFNSSIPNGKPLGDYSDPALFKPVPPYTISNGMFDLPNVAK